MRNMSFSMTTPQMRAEEKDITRRIGWGSLKAGDRVMAVEKGMGLKKGEKVKPIYEIEIVSARAERLDAITQDDCRREGFPDFTPAEFVKFFCKGGRKITGATIVNRIEFRKV